MPTYAQPRPRKGSFHMHTNYLTPKAEPTGSTLVRLQDVPLADRLAALHRIMARDNLSGDEAATMLDLCLDPGDASARIAA